MCFLKSLKQTTTFTENSSELKVFAKGTKLLSYCKVVNFCFLLQRNFEKFLHFTVWCYTFINLFCYEVINSFRVQKNLRTTDIISSLWWTSLNERSSRLHLLYYCWLFYIFWEKSSKKGTCNRPSQRMYEYMVSWVYSPIRRL